MFPLGGRSHPVVPRGSNHCFEGDMSPIAAALHNQVLVMFCYIDIGNGVLIKAWLLLPRKPEPILWCLTIAAPQLLILLSAPRYRYHLRSSQWKVFVENESLECLHCFKLCGGFQPPYPNSPVHSSLCSLKCAAFFIFLFAQFASSHAWFHKHAAITFSFGSQTIFEESRSSQEPVIKGGRSKQRKY